MSLDLQQLFNSPFALRFISLLAHTIPPAFGYPLCDRIGSWVATQRNAKVTQAVRINQWIARGANLSGTELDQAVREALQNNARDIYNLYHYLGRPAAMREMICFSPQACEILERPEFADRGLIILGLHLSNFDFILRFIISELRFKALVLTIPDPQGGRRLEYEMRKEVGMNIVPASVSALRGAIRHLENGGTLVTGLDRPIPEPRQKPMFFGMPASLPIHYVALACKARVPIVVMAAIQQADGKYHVFRSRFIEMEAGLEPMRNAEQVLKQAEEFIRQVPQQWNVPLPVWPEIQNFEHGDGEQN
jgi:KDO2-lipid IV(A) lauroyltransferase